jgi:hypothetical protein
MFAAVNIVFFWRCVWEYLLHTTYILYAVDIKEVAFEVVNQHDFFIQREKGASVKKARKGERRKRATMAWLLAPGTGCGWQSVQ